VFYDVTSMVTKVEKIEELPKLIKNSLSSFNFSFSELSFLIESIESNQIIVPYWNMMKEFVILESLQSHGKTKKTIDEFEKLYKKYDENFFTMASAYQKIS
jgi:hypothetical protein